jgi:hypothetical protein
VPSDQVGPSCRVAHHPGEPGDLVGDIEVTRDGTVWATGFVGYVPELCGLARYDPATARWEHVRPWPGHGDVPAETMTVGPDGYLWVLLADWQPDYGERHASGKPPVIEAALARLAYLGPDGWERHLDDGWVCSVGVDNDGGVWVSRYGHIERLTPGR